VQNGATAVLIPLVGRAYNRQMLRFLFAAALVVGLGAPAGAQVPDAVYHGELDVLPSVGKFDYDTGVASLKLRKWRFLVVTDSNGLAPDQETIVVLVGENSFPLPPGALKRSRNGKVFSYKAAKDDPSPLRALRMRNRGYFYTFNVTLRDVPLGTLTTNDGVCLPVALLVGDDDAFNGGVFRRPGFTVDATVKQLRIQRSCPVPWPWEG
jgi:hypothetical protein